MGHVPLLEWFYAQGASLHDTQDDDTRFTLLHTATTCPDNTHVVRWLVAHGCSVDARDASGQTPLMLAAQCGHLDMVRLLLELGASPLAVAEDGCTPLMAGAIAGHLDIMQLCVAAGASPHDEMDAHDNSVLLCAAEAGSLPCVQWLVTTAGCSLLDRNRQDDTALSRAAARGHVHIAAWILDYLQRHSSPGAALSYGVARAVLNAASRDHLDLLQLICTYQGCDLCFAVGQNEAGQWLRAVSVFNPLQVRARYVA